RHRIGMWMAWYFQALQKPAGIGAFRDREGGLSMCWQVCLPQLGSGLLLQRLTAGKGIEPIIVDVAPIPLAGVLGPSALMRCPFEHDGGRIIVPSKSLNCSRSVRHLLLHVPISSADPDVDAAVVISQICNEFSIAGPDGIRYHPVAVVNPRVQMH